MTKKMMLMQTAKKLFAQKGLHGTPTALIPKVAGVSNGILFHYFPTKDILITELYVDLRNQIHDYVLQQTYLGATLKESIFTIWLASIEWHLEHPDDFDFMLQFEHSPYFNSVTEQQNQYMQLLLGLAQKGVDQQTFKHLEPLLVVRIMEGITNTTVKYLREDSERMNDFGLRANLFEMAWDTLKK